MGGHLGHGALGWGGPDGGACDDEAGRTDAESVPGGACEVSVFGGAAVHLVQTVKVEVITVVEIVAVV